MIIKLGENQNAEMGNKAKFLSDMKASGFNVPDGIVLDKNVYLEIMRNLQIAYLLRMDTF